VAHFGISGFGTDEGLDWLAQLAEKPSARRVRGALERYRAYESQPHDQERVTPEYIESILRSLRESWVKNPPPAFLESGLNIEDWMTIRSSEIRDHYESGRYLDETYGPVEQQRR
jgi:hypothetical protein